MTRGPAGAGTTKAVSRRAAIALAAAATGGAVASVSASASAAAQGAAEGGGGGDAIVAIGLFVAARDAAVPAGTTMVRTAGYAGHGFGEATYRADRAVDDAFVRANPRTAFRLRDGRGFRLETMTPDAAMFGAAGDGQADDGDALATMVRWSIARFALLGAGERRGVAMTLPAGRFRVGTSDALLPPSLDRKEVGYHLRGAGTGLTTILFAPTGGSRRLFSNNNAFMECSVEGIDFVGAAPGLTFMHSFSRYPPGSVQAWTFRDVVWSGRWSKGVHMTGNNNNSEWTFDRCAVYGEMTDFLYTADDGSASDQFLNFWFRHFKFWPTARGTGDDTNCMVNMARGGSIRIADSDFSGIESGTLFKLRGATHAQGVCAFTLAGSRFELKSPQVRVLLCEWPSGIVLLQGNDFSSQSTTYPRDTIAFSFVHANVPGAQVSLLDNVLIGRAEFVHGPNDFEFRKGVTFERNAHAQFADFYDMIVMRASLNDDGAASVEIGSGNRGSDVQLSTRPARTPDTAYRAGDERRSGHGLYRVVTGGRSGGGTLTGKGGAIRDGGVVWRWLRNGARDYVTGSVIGGPDGGRAPVARRVAAFGGVRPGAAPSTAELILPPDVVIVAAQAGPGMTLALDDGTPLATGAAIAVAVGGSAVRRTVVLHMRARGGADADGGRARAWVEYLG